MTYSQTMFSMATLAGYRDGRDKGNDEGADAWPGDELRHAYRVGYDAGVADYCAATEASERRATPPRPVYEFEACRYYGVGERYSNGAGLQFTTNNPAEAYSALARFAERALPSPGMPVYACEVRQFPGDGKEPRVLARSGPPMSVAKATSARAWSERRAILSRDREARAAGGFATPSKGREVAP